MGMLSRLEQRQRLESPRVPLSKANVLEAIGMGETTSAGVTMNTERALGLSAFWLGCRVISQTIAGLPLGVYEHVPEGRRAAVEHPVYRLLTVKPNPYMSAFSMKELTALHLLCQGNSYYEIARDGGGSPVALWPLLPDMTTPKLGPGGHKVYDTSVDGRELRLTDSRVLHIPGMGWDGVKGYNVVKVHRDTLGMTWAANEYGARFYANSGRPSGYIEHPAKPGTDERAALREEWNAVHGGLTNAQRTAVLWGGMKWHPVSLPPEEAQFLGTRSMQIEEVARILNLNPILLQHHEKATTWGSGVAQFLIAFAKFTIIPWLERIEDSMNLALFTEAEQGRYYVKFNSAALLRGDLEMQAKILEIKRRNGVINADEWRALDDENPLPDGLGKHYMMPLNMSAMKALVPDDDDDTAATDDVQQTALNGAQIASLLSILEQVTQKLLSPDAAKAAIEAAFPSLTPEQIDQMVDNSVEFDAPTVPANVQRSLIPERRSIVQRQRDAHKALFEDGARRFVRREVDNLTRAIERAFAGNNPTEALNQWIEEFYPGQHRVIIQTMMPIVSALAEVVAADVASGLDTAPGPEDIERFAREYTETLATRETGSSIGQLRTIMTEAVPDELRESLATRAAEWAETRPEKIAGREVVAVASGAVRNVAQVSNTKLVWRANRDACPLCRQMDGRTIGSKDYFGQPGDSVSAEGSEPLTLDVHLGGPPLHRGCICTVELA